MAVPRQPLRRRRARVALLGAAVLVAVAAAIAWATRPGAPPSDGGPAPIADVEADSRAQPGAGEHAAAPGPATGERRRDADRATRVPDVPAAWQRIHDQAARWPAPDDAPDVGTETDLPTVPAARMRDTIGVNVDLWRTEWGYRDFAGIVRRVEELNLRHARVNMQSRATFGLARMQQLGRAGVRLDVIMGDAYGRYDTAPFSELERRLHASVLPYVDAVEGTNEADLAQQAGWVRAAREHQRQVVGAVAGERADPIGVIAPSVGRFASIEALGDVADLADAGNAHAYASGEEPGAALGQWLDALSGQVPDGPTIVTETGFMTDTRQRKGHTPTSEQAAAAYVPRTILEAIRRGVPQVYLYELADRWNDPFGVDTAAHFGLLDERLRPKPAWDALVRLQRALLDDGRPDADVEPVRATIEAAPHDLRVLALRHRDGTVALALWRAAKVWSPEQDRDLDVPVEPVRLRLPADVGGALATDLVTGDRRRLPSGERMELELTGAPVVVTGLPPSG